MERISRLCEEVHAFDRRGERTGVVIELRALRSRARACTSITDLIRKYKLYGDGFFYLPVGHWPAGENVVELDNVKWMGVTQSFRVPRSPRRRARDSSDE